MTKEKDIDESLVTVGKPIDGGCVFVSFESDPTFPTGAADKIGTGWESLGEVSDNGYTESKSVSTTDHKGWHGSVVLTTVDDETQAYKMEFLEVNRPAAAKVYYGSENVEVDKDGNLTHISGKPGKNVPVALVIDELESNGWLRRTVIKQAVVTSFDEVPHKRGSLMLYGMTFTANLKDGTTFDIYRAKPAEEEKEQEPPAEVEVQQIDTQSLKKSATAATK